MMTHNSVTVKARLLDGPFKERQDTNENFLRQVDMDRLLAGFREQAGLPPKASRYGGWEAKDITGHSLGHYLSAVAHAGMTDRVNNIVEELAACQNPDGYLLPVVKSVFEDVRAGKIDVSAFSLNGAWVPMYTLHKVLAGLRDVGTPKALDVACKLVNWLEGVLRPLTPAQVQEFLTCEHGGMLEVLVDLGRVDMAERYFMHQAVLDPLLRGEDKLDGLHANTIIPKVIGLARLYEVTGKAEYRRAAEMFWDVVVTQRSYCTGGHSDSEHFFPVEDFPKHLSPYTCETCNTYNMLKLTARLFAWQPRDKYMAFAERALWNHLAANIGRAPGEYGYFLALGSVATKVWSKPFDAWWCCVGTGMENPTRYGEQIYSCSDDTLRVNQYIASEVQWNGATVRLETRFPEEDTVRITSDKPVRITLRQPEWCDAIQTRFELNGTIEVRLPMKQRLEPLSHSNGKIAAVMNGPIVMAAVVPGPGATERYSDHLKARGKTDALPPVLVDGKSDLEFIPFYKIYEEPYAVYFPVMTKAEWAQRELGFRAEQERCAREEAATIDFVEPGFQQSEVEHDLKSGRSQTGDLHGRKYREGEWFSYEMEVDPAKPVALVATYRGGPWAKHAPEVLVDGTSIAPPERHPGKWDFFDVAYPIPTALMIGKKTVTVRFQAGALALFRLKMVRSEP